MSETKHTPGPWVVVTEDGSIGSVAAADGSAVAQAQIRGTLKKPNNEERRANAHLIAAAPELLKACKAALPYLRNHIGMTLDEGPGDRIALDMCEEAIAKATGESK
jgi:hypothetical protein